MKTLCAALVAFVALSVPMSARADPLGDAAKAQQAIIRQNNPAAAEANARYEARQKQAAEIERVQNQWVGTRMQFETKLAELHHALYLAAIDAGVSLGNAQVVVEKAASDPTRRFRPKIITSRYGGRFITVKGAMATYITPAFLVSGYGLVDAIGIVEDPDVKKTGTIGPRCQYELHVGASTHTYPCTAFLSGKQDEQILTFMKAAFAKQLEARRR